VGTNRIVDTTGHTPSATFTRADTLLSSCCQGPSPGSRLGSLSAQTVHVGDSRRTASASRWTRDAARFSAFTAEAAPGWDAVADGAVLQEEGVALVRDGGLFVGMQPGAAPAEERGVTVHVVVAQPDGARLAQLLDATASGRLPARVHAVVPLDQVAAAHRAVAKGGVRGRYVLQP
jgi:NADPH:quinone reductase-like Zn-dependent oxidoreductase